MAIDTKSLTDIITEFRALQSKDAVSPESLGSILQRIVDLLATAGTSETVNNITKLLDGFKAAGQALTEIFQGQSDRNHIYAKISTVNLATGAVGSSSGIFIQQATTDRAGAMRSLIIIFLTCALVGCKSQKNVSASQSAKVDSLAHSEHHRTMAVIDSAMRHIDFSFDTLKVNIERPVEYAEAPEIIRLTAVRGRVIDQRRGLQSARYGCLSSIRCRGFDETHRYDAPI